MQRGLKWPQQLVAVLLLTGSAIGSVEVLVSLLSSRKEGGRWWKFPY
jgi:hypothetical protein